jgi:ATP-dependent helicase/nuclease subunit B
MSWSTFRHWVGQTLEGMRFSPPYPAQAQLLVLPLKQLWGRALAAVVLPGCDELHLPVSAEPADLWTPAQRQVLGLPSRQTLDQINRAAWEGALRFAQVDVLWRRSENGEPVQASGFVQAWRLQSAQPLASDLRRQRPIAIQATPAPQPSGALLPVARLSSSAYEDLRRCPYRFFALRQLQLQAADELDLEWQKRDFGNWLHAVLKCFHEDLPQPADRDERLARINQAAQRVTQACGLPRDEFLPFWAAWPRVREGYLNWLEAHEADGAQFLEAESWKEMPLGDITLVGKIDRIDRLQNGSRLVLDYKTEARAQTTQRIQQPLEDTQLAFYAALLGDDQLAAAYVSVDEKTDARSYFQGDIQACRDALKAGIQQDMARIAQAKPLLALGAGQACAFCQARGLCRKDFWATAT